MQEQPASPTSSVSPATSGSPPTLKTLMVQAFPGLRYVPELVLDLLSPQQALWLTLNQREALYGGAAGGGKSFALLMAALQYVHVPGYAALIVRRTFPQLTQPGMIVPVAKEWLAGTDARWSERDMTWQFPSGAAIRFGHVQDENAALNYQGGAYQFVAFDELTQFTETMYTYIAFSRQRRALHGPISSVPIRVRSTTNPGGPGHQWVKKRFVTERDPALVFIPARVKDNLGLDAADYEKSLMHLPDVLRAQLMDGDWGAFEGAAYPQFSEATHVVPPLEVPDEFERFESMDFGTVHPTAWLAWAVDYDGNLIAFDELYEPGLPSVIAPKVLKRRAVWKTDTCYGDPSIFRNVGTTNRWGQPASVVTEFHEMNVSVTAANNDTVAGYVRLAELVRPDLARMFPAWHPRAGEQGAPRLFVTRSCPNLIEQMQAAVLAGDTEPHARESVSRKWEGPYGHAHASARYGCLSRPDPSPVPGPEPESPQAAVLQRYEQRVEREARDTSYAI